MDQGCAVRLAVKIRDTDRTEIGVIAAIAVVLVEACYPLKHKPRAICYPEVMSAPSKANRSLAGKSTNPACLKVATRAVRNSACMEVTTCMKPEERIHQAVTQVKDVSPESYKHPGRPTFFIYGEGSNELTINGKVNPSGRGRRPRHGEETGTIGTWEIPLVLASKCSLLGSESNQVLTTTSAERSTLGKSEQFVVQVSEGNASSLELHTFEYEATSLKGAVNSNVRDRRPSSMLSNGLYKLNYHLSTWLEALTSKVLLLESRMREIRLSGLARGFPLRDTLFLNAEGGLL